MNLQRIPCRFARRQSCRSRSAWRNSAESLLRAIPSRIPQAIRSIRKATGQEPNQPPAEKDSSAKGITYKLDPAIGKGRPDWQAKESYTLTVAKDGSGVEIAASDAHGLFNGVQTLVQLTDKGADGKWRVPSVKIEDYPRFPWRGYLLDPARHFRPKAEVLAYYRSVGDAQDERASIAS